MTPAGWATEDPNALSPELEGKVESWRQALQAIGPRETLRQLSRQQAETCWTVGREIGEELGHQRHGTRTSFLQAIADRIGKPRSLLYDLVRVGEGFPDGLLQQHWSWHVLYARRLHDRDPEYRAAALSLLEQKPHWQSLRVAREDIELLASPSTAMEKAAGGGEAEDLFNAAVDAFGKLIPRHKVPFIGHCLDLLDVSMLTASMDPDGLEAISHYALELKEKLADRRLTGPSRTGPSSPARGTPDDSARSSA